MTTANAARRYRNLRVDRFLVRAAENEDCDLGCGDVDLGLADVFAV